jgi:hypothetical protein
MYYSNKSNSEVFPSFLTPWRLKWYPRALLFAFAVGYLIAIFSGHDASTMTGRLGGDYPAFYGAGRIIAQGNWHNLFDLEEQFKIQKSLYPGEDNVFMPFPYPPFVAVAYYPLSLIPYRLSYILHTMIMVAAIFLIVFLLYPIHVQIRHNYLFFACFILSFYPMFRAILGGQNTAITLLLIVLSWRMAIAQKDLLAGIILGLLLFKPQFGLLIICFYVLSGRWLVGAGSLCTAFVLYGIGASISGPMWIANWYQFTIWLSQADAAINYDKAVSWFGFCQAIFGWSNHIAFIIGWAMSLATGIIVSFVWLTGARRADLTAQAAIGTAALLLIPPHVNYYDVSLALFTCLAIVGNVKKGSWLLFGLFWSLSFSQPLSRILGFSPLFLVALATLVISLFVLGKPVTRFIRSH